MASVNRVILIGNITREIELRYTPKGTAVIDLGIAMNHKYTTESGEKKEEVTFATVTFWGKSAETIQKWCKKGDPIYVEGRLAQESWDDKDTGKKVTKTKVTGESFQFLGGKRDGNGGQSEQRKPDGDKPKSGPDPDLDPIEDGEVPF